MNRLEYKSILKRLDYKDGRRLGDIREEGDLKDIIYVYNEEIGEVGKVLLICGIVCIEYLKKGIVSYKYLLPINLSNYYNRFNTVYDNMYFNNKPLPYIYFPLYIKEIDIEDSRLNF